MAAEPAPYSNPDDDNALIRRLKAAYSSTALATVRPSMWSAAIGTATAGAAALLTLMRATVPPLAAASCAGGALGYAYTYSCFRDDGTSGAAAPLPSSSSPSSLLSSASAPAGGAVTTTAPAAASSIAAAAAVAAARERERARRSEGFMAGIGTSALVASGQLSAFRASGGNPLVLNVLLLSSASAFYYAGLGFSESPQSAKAGALR